MTCSTCTHWNPKKTPAMAKHHMAVCNLGPTWVYMPPGGKCNGHKPAAADVVAARVVWLEKTHA